MLEEMGRPYQLIDKSTAAGDLQTADYLRLNPNARIPTLVDGDVVIWESMAINIYLSEKYDKRETEKVSDWNRDKSRLMRERG
jgi:glutathione S-transferase